MIYKTPHRKLNVEQREPQLKAEGELRCSGGVRSSCSTYGTRHVTLGLFVSVTHHHKRICLIQSKYNDHIIKQYLILVMIQLKKYFTEMQTQKHLFTTKKLKRVIRGLNQRRQTMQWSKEKKRQRDKQWNTKHYTEN